MSSGISFKNAQSKNVWGVDETRLTKMLITVKLDDEDVGVHHILLSAFSMLKSSRI